ncbi:MAG: peptidylprolyl isomerase [Candidatus Buchananbacteria bacterium]|jgi:peptidylprolyl isomerase
MLKKSGFFLVLIVLSVILAGCGVQDSSNSAQTSEIPADSQQNSSTNQDLKNMPDASQITIDKNKTYTAIMHTDQGDIEITLNAKATPITVNNFVTLSKKNFYENTIFHRIIKGFMIQGGDPKGDGTGGPGYSFADEPFTGEYNRGTIAMANAGPNTNGSQFFIMHADYPLPKNYVIFGQVIKGLDVVDKIAEAPVKMSASGEPSQPLTPVKVKSVEIIEK